MEYIFARNYLERLGAVPPPALGNWGWVAYRLGDAIFRLYNDRIELEIEKFPKSRTAIALGDLSPLGALDATGAVSLGVALLGWAESMENHIRKNPSLTKHLQTITRLNESILKSFEGHKILEDEIKTTEQQSSGMAGGQGLSR
ncbi:MAG TPA: hypothetical protein HA224_00450 [Nanoarchaeota archaeon]|nr:hypothetical protein [Nanoarchaeota archaeon]